MGGYQIKGLSLFSLKNTTDMQDRTELMAAGIFTVQMLTRCILEEESQRVVKNGMDYYLKPIFFIEKDRFVLCQHRGKVVKSCPWYHFQGFINKVIFLLEIVIAVLTFLNF